MIYIIWPRGSRVGRDWFEPRRTPHRPLAHAPLTTPPSGEQIPPDRRAAWPDSVCQSPSLTRPRGDRDRGLHAVLHSRPDLLSLRPPRNAGAPGAARLSRHPQPHPPGPPRRALRRRRRPRLPHVLPGRRPPGDAQWPRRAPPLRLERLQLRPLPLRAAPARPAPLPAGARRSSPTTSPGTSATTP